MKEKMNQMFRDKLFLVMLVLGLLTMVAAAGVVTIRRGNGQEQKPYVDMQGQDEYFAEEAKDQAPVAGNSNAENSGSEITQEEQVLAEAASNQDNAAAEQGHIAEEAGPETGNGQNTGLAANSTTDDGADPAVKEAGAGGSAATALVLNFADACKRQCPAGLQHGFHHLFPDPGTVQMQSRPGHPERGQHPGVCSGCRKGTGSRKQ